MQYPNANRQIMDSLQPQHRSEPLRKGSEHSHAMATQIHLINFDHGADQLTTFNCRNPHLASVLCCQGVDGALVDRQQMMKNGVMLEDCSYSSESLGRALSHIELWKKVHTENRPITIFETDVIATFGFEEKAGRLACSIPTDWDIILWGYVFGPRPPMKVWVDLGFSKMSIRCCAPAEFDDFKSFQSTDYHYSLFRLLNAWGTLAYSVSPHGARMLLNSCLPLRHRAIQISQPGVSYWDDGIDGPMNTVYPSMKSFICIPPLVTLAHGHSDSGISVLRQ